MTHDLEDLALYGYCSLRYRYKVVWGLPYQELSAEEAYAQTLRKAISRLLFSLPRRGAEWAKTASLRVFEGTWESIPVHWDAEKHTGLKLEGHLALYDFVSRLHSDDRVIGGKFETEVSISSVVVRHQIDGLVMRDDSEPSRAASIVHISREKSPLWSPRFQPLQFQWTMAVVRRQLGHDRRVVHWVFSPFSKTPPRIHEGAVERLEFRSVVESLAKGVAAQVYFQTPHSERCRTCWYQRICTAKHCGEVTNEEIEELRRKL